MQSGALLQMLACLPEVGDCISQLLHLSQAHGAARPAQQCQQPNHPLILPSRPQCIHHSCERQRAALLEESLQALGTHVLCQPSVFQINF